MNKYYWIVNLDRCIGCETCVIACKQENQTIEGVQYRRVHQINPELFPDHPTFRISLGCNHCETPACLPACPVHAYTQKDGIVMHNPDVCIGCQYCRWVCPFDVPQYATAKGKMEKCNLCYRRLEKGLKPACVDACPTGAIKLVERLEGNELRLPETIPGFPEGKTHPKIRMITRRRLADKGGSK